MKALARLGLAVSAALLGLAPAMAQDSPVAITPAPAPDSGDVVGPAQLRDFNLSGNVVRQADPPAEQARQPQAARRQAQPASPDGQSGSAPAAEGPAVRQDRAGAGPRRESGQARAPAAQDAAPAAASPALDLAPPSPAEPLFGEAPSLPSAAGSGAFTPAPDPAESGGGFLPLPWLFALLLAGGAAAFYFLRQRGSPVPAGGPRVSELVRPEPRPEAPPRPGQPAPSASPAPPPPAAPPAAAPVGLVTTSFKPKLEMQFAPERVAIEGDRVLIDFQALVSNSGNGPARDVLLEGAMFSAGPDQEKSIRAFFDNPAGRGERVPSIPPLKSMAFRSSVNLPLDRLNRFKAGDRTVFVPLVGFNLLYRSGSGEAQLSTGFLVGRDTKGEKLAPFSLDQQPRAYAGVGAREIDRLDRR